MVDGFGGTEAYGERRMAATLCIREGSSHSLFNHLSHLHTSILIDVAENEWVMCLGCFLQAQTCERVILLAEEARRARYW